MIIDTKILIHNDDDINLDNEHSKMGIGSAIITQEHLGGKDTPTQVPSPSETRNSRQWNTV